MKKNKKLLFLVNNLNFFVSHRLGIAVTAANKGLDVVIGYGESGGLDPKLLKKKGFKVHFIPISRGSINPIKELKAIFLIWKFFKKEKPDIAHLIAIKPNLYGGIISLVTGVPALVSAVSGLGTLFISKNLIIKIIRLSIYPFFKLSFNHPNQVVIVQNKDDSRKLVKWGVLNPSKIKLIKGSGVNLKNFKKLAEPKGVPVVSFAARLLVDKGVYEFVSAGKILKKRGVKAKFFLAGNLDNQNPTGLNQLDLDRIKNEASWIKILGFQKNISKLFSRSHIVCLPSYREGFPKTLIEAAASSRAVVTTDVPGCRDAIIPFKTGLLVPKKNSAKLADAIQWLIENPIDRVKMGKEGRKLAEKEFFIDKIIQHHLDIYKNLIKDK
ncbi:glycosyltransferase family 4 protein [Candidatus Pelagibacter sp.]|nr:glycosyltransferase family 4 protein [Candidatus Pelagibacter sp.]